MKVYESNTKTKASSEGRALDLLSVISSASNPRDALSVLLRLFIAAPDDGRAASALAKAEEIARTLSRKVVLAVQIEIENDDLSNAERQLHHAILQLAMGETDDKKRSNFHRIAAAFGDGREVDQCPIC